MLLSDNSFSSSNSDDIVLKNVFSIIYQHPLTKGFPREKIVEDFFINTYLEAKESGLDELTNSLGEWKSFMDDIFNQRKDHIELDDEKNIIIRAFTLFLMRERSHRIINVPKLVNNSTKFNGLYKKDNDSLGFSSGENVKSIALLFSSLREGFRGLPKKFKDYGDEQLEMLDRYAKIIIHLILKDFVEENMIPNLEISISGKTLLDHKWNLVDNKNIIYSKKIILKDPLYMAIKAFHSNNLFKIYPVSQSSVKVIITSEKSKMNSVMMEMKNINNVNNVICKSIIKNYKNKKIVHSIIWLN